MTGSWRFFNNSLGRRFGAVTYPGLPSVVYFAVRDLGNFRQGVPMGTTQRQKKCRRCQLAKSVGDFVDANGVANERGVYCHDCYWLREEEFKKDIALEQEAVKRKLQIVYGAWWPHYCLPTTFAAELFEERDFCPYCLSKLPPHYIPAKEAPNTIAGRAHLDHMDPLDLGGEDSIRNVVYVCDGCNGRKGRRGFLEWLGTLSPEAARVSREIYQAKHSHPPEEFVPGQPTERCDGVEALVCLDEDDLREMFPQPMVNGPPSNQPETITVSVKINR